MQGIRSDVHRDKRRKVFPKENPLEKDLSSVVRQLAARYPL